MMKKNIAILGSTGSIGQTTFDILKKDKNFFDIRLLTTNESTNILLKQAKIFNVKNLIITNHEKYISFKKIHKKKYKIYNNFECLDKIFKNKKIDYVMSSISGFNGLDPTLKIIKFTSTIAIANKEAIICGWNLIDKELKKHGSKFIPVDSEHFSIWSLIKNKKINNIEKIYITASGGPFAKLPLNKFKSILPKDALKHPNWTMGKKISIDSATMMNKVFEIIEAKKIFNLQYKDIEILIHPKSYIHAIIKFKNGLTKILLHDTTMTIPIFNSLFENSNKVIKTKEIDLSILNDLQLTKVDVRRYPIIDVLRKLPNNDSIFEILVVHVNDKLVDLFLKKKIKFNQISSKLLKIIECQEFKKYKHIKVNNIREVKDIINYLSLKIDYLSV
tara:strand:+ start:1317 stop:2483 length:1167 start_codon:yes stop_codon:yes gene_type:complete